MVILSKNTANPPFLLSWSRRESKNIDKVAKSPSLRPFVNSWIILVDNSAKLSKEHHMQLHYIINKKKRHPNPFRHLFRSLNDLKQVVEHCSTFYILGQQKRLPAIEPRAFFEKGV